MSDHGARIETIGVSWESPATSRRPVSDHGARIETRERGLVEPIRPSRPVSDHGARIETTADASQMVRALQSPRERSRGAD